jgi:transcription antitermination factor NusG
MSEVAPAVIDEEERLCWYAMSATFGRALKAKEYLEKNSVECFVPMKYSVAGRNASTKKLSLVPAVNNLLFVHSQKSRIQELKSRLSYLQYHTRPDGLGRNTPIVVPDKDMQQFITLCEQHIDKLRYLSPQEVDLSQGTPVRIVGGIYDGIEGTFIKLLRHRSKKFIVHIQGIAAVMIVDISDGHLQVIDPTVCDVTR